MKEEFRRIQESNIQLKEEHKRLEMEREKILGRIKLLGGEKEVIVINTDGLKKTYKVTTFGIEKLLQEIREMGDEALSAENIVERTRGAIF